MGVKPVEEWTFDEESRYFNGIDDWYNAGQSNEFDFGSDDFTVSAWVYLNDFSLSRYALSKGTTAGGVGGWSLSFKPSKKIMFLVDDGTNLSSVQIGGQLEEEVWTHISGVRRGSTIHLYKNGIEIGSSDCSDVGSTDTLKDLSIGKRSGSSFYWSGMIDEVKLYNYALTLEEISESAGISAVIDFIPQEVYFYPKEKPEIKITPINESYNILVEIKHADSLVYSHIISNMGINRFSHFTEMNFYNRPRPYNLKISYAVNDHIELIQEYNFILDRIKTNSKLLFHGSGVREFNDLTLEILNRVKDSPFDGFMGNLRWGCYTHPTYEELEQNGIIDLVRQSPKQFWPTIRFSQFRDCCPSKREGGWACDLEDRYLDVFDTKGAYTEFKSQFIDSLKFARETGSDGICINTEHGSYTVGGIAEDTNRTAEDVYNRLKEIGYELAEITNEEYPEAVILTYFAKPLNYWPESKYPYEDSYRHMSNDYILEGMLERAKDQGYSFTIYDGAELSLWYLSTSQEHLNNKIINRHKLYIDSLEQYPNFELGATHGTYLDVNKLNGGWASWRDDVLNGGGSIEAHTIEDLLPYYKRLFETNKYMWIYPSGGGLSWCSDIPEDYTDCIYNDFDPNISKLYRPVFDSLTKREESKKMAIYHLFFISQKQTFNVGGTDYDAWVVNADGTDYYFMENTDPRPDGYVVRNIIGVLASSGANDMLYYVTSKVAEANAASTATEYAGGSQVSTASAYLTFAILSTYAKASHSAFPARAALAKAIPVTWAGGSGTIEDWIAAGYPLENFQAVPGLEVLGVK